uniref:Fork-head domain-containing protein n=1 Tax=Hucho hucho TaxID=62062 RepID=A0A4W5N4I6_9TELE
PSFNDSNLSVCKLLTSTQGPDISALCVTWCEKNSTTKKMQSTTENIMETLLPPQAPSNVVLRRKNQRYGKKKSTTYLGLIVYVIQVSRDKMLTFSQLMDKLGAFLSGDRKGIENNIRVYLSSNDCFVKVQVSPYMPHSKKNFWKVDESQITAKMARRHFKGILDLFTELSTKVRMEAEQISERFSAVYSPTPTLTSPHMQKNNEVNFSSPFSVESILNRHSLSRLCRINCHFVEFNVKSTKHDTMSLDSGSKFIEKNTKCHYIDDFSQIQLVFHVNSTLSRRFLGSK